jgi:fructose-1-phosphate kinase PfkB-like protein
MEMRVGFGSASSGAHAATQTRALSQRTDSCSKVLRYVSMTAWTDCRAAAVSGSRSSDPTLVARNVVGAGDCLLAGLAVGLRRGLTPAETLRLGVACGAAKAQNAETGFMRRADVEALLPKIELRNITR